RVRYAGPGGSRAGGQAGPHSARQYGRGDAAGGGSSGGRARPAGSQRRREPGDRARDRGDGRGFHLGGKAHAFRAGGGYRGGYYGERITVLDWPSGWFFTTVLGRFIRDPRSCLIAMIVSPSATACGSLPRIASASVFPSRVMLSDTGSRS